MGMRRFAGLLVLVLAVVCTACVSGAIAPGAPVQATLQDYRLGPGDIVRVAVFGEPNLSGDFPVGPTGAVAFPLVGEVPAQGKTTAEFVQTLTETLQGGYVRQPRVTALIATYRPYYILGEVSSPGTYPYTPGMTVLNAVATAGGFSERATSRRVFIQHSDESSEREYELTSTTQLLPGDTLRIPERRF
jgi:protein involved in polysaccharide export with SLBB domain